MPTDIPPLQTRALDAVRSGDDIAQRAVIDSILSEGVTAAEYTTTQAAVRGLKSQAESISSRISRHSERAKELSNSGQPNRAAELQRGIREDTELLAELQSFTKQLSGGVTLGRGATKLAEEMRAVLHSVVSAAGQAAFDASHWLSNLAGVEPTIRSITTVPAQTQPKK